jgi:hypothetical protein
MLNILPVIALAIGPSGEGLVVSKPAAAQVTLAEALADADSIDWVRTGAHWVKFGIDRAGEAYEIDATTAKRGLVTRVAIRDLGRGRGRADELGNLSWLADAMLPASAVTRLVVDASGTVTLVTREGDRYQALPGHSGSRSNDAVEGRWAASWNA